MMFNDEELTSVSEDLDWTLENFKLGGTIAALGAIKVDNDKVNLISRPNTCLCRIFSMLKISRSETQVVTAASALRPAPSPGVTRRRRRLRRRGRGGGSPGAGAAGPSGSTTP